MPYKISKLASGYYSLKNSLTGRVHSKHTTKAKAEAQMRLLQMVDQAKSVCSKCVKNNMYI